MGSRARPRATRYSIEPKVRWKVRRYLTNSLERACHTGKFTTSSTADSGSADMGCSESGAN